MHKKIDKKQIQTVAISACPVHSAARLEQQSMLVSIANPNKIIKLKYKTIIYIINKIIFLIIKLHMKLICLQISSFLLCAAYPYCLLCIDMRSHFRYIAARSMLSCIFSFV